MRVLQDHSEALIWYKLAAKQGSAAAQFNLGMIYQKGEGVLRDDTEAIYWYQLAAELGNSTAQFNLAAMYYNNDQCEVQEKLKAYMWLYIAASNGHKEASHWRDKLAVTIPSLDLSTAQSMAADYVSDRSG